MLDNLYENIGGKIKNWAKWIFIVEAIFAIITGVILILAGIEFELYILLGMLTLLFGPIVAWVSSWILYAFGELVEDIHELRYNVNTRTIEKNVSILATPVIKANREAEENDKRAAEEKARRAAEEKARRDAEEPTRRNADAIAIREAEKNEERIGQKKEQTLAEKLEYALKFHTDDGMIRYLKGLQDETVQNILNSPQHLIRERIKNLLESL